MSVESTVSRYIRVTFGQYTRFSDLRVTRTLGSREEALEYLDELETTIKDLKSAIDETFS